MGSVTAINAARGAGAPTVAEAKEAFLGTPGVCASRNTARAYAGVLDKIAEHLGSGHPLAEVTGEQIEAALTELWGQCAESTWNRNLAVVRRWLSWCTDTKQWAAPELPRTAARRREPAHETRAVDQRVIDRLCGRRDVPLRDKVLIAMLYETSSRASAVLALNVEELDLANRCATIRQKGGDQLEIAWDDRTAKVLGKLISGRSSGPVFLTDIKAGPARAAATPAADIDPDTGRTRLSYGRARALIERYTNGTVTLHQLRHSSLTHLAERGVGTTTLMAKSGHKNLRSLQRYARPSFAAVQEATALLSESTSARRR